MVAEKAKRIGFADLGKEPFRIFFPEGVLAGILGVSLWPLYFTGITKFYPGQAHARRNNHLFFARPQNNQQISRRSEFGNWFNQDRLSQLLAQGEPSVADQANDVVL